MSKFKKHKRIYYVPGIISLILIPLVLWNFFENYLEEYDYNVISLDTFSDYLLKDLFEDSPQYNFKNGYEYIDLNVPINFGINDEKKYLALIKNHPIDEVGIRFHLSYENNYNDFVNVLNLMGKVGHKNYAYVLDEDNLYMIPNVVPQIQVLDYPIMCGFGYERRSRFEIVISDFKEFSQKHSKIFLSHYNWLFPIGCLRDFPSENIHSHWSKKLIFKF